MEKDDCQGVNVRVADRPRQSDNTSTVDRTVAVSDSLFAPLS